MPKIIIAVTVECGDIPPDLVATRILEVLPTHVGGVEVLDARIAPTVHLWTTRHHGDPDLSPEALAQASLMEEDLARESSAGGYFQVIRVDAAILGGREYRGEG